MTTAEAAVRLAVMDQVLILTHVRPDGDTIGSAAALCCGLRALGKTAYLLPNPELTATYAPYAAPYLAEADFAPAYVVSVDIAALSLLPENARPYQDRIALAIDHHPSQEFFARETCLEADSAACGEIVYDILRQLTPLTPEMIHALLMRAPAHDDLRRNEADHQHQVGDQRDAQADTVVVGPRPHILPAVVEGQFDTRPAGGFRFVVTGCFSHCGVSEF